jgi:ribosomal protein S21
MSYKTYNPNRSGTTIYVFDNDISKALSRLKHETASLMKELKMKRYHEPNTAKRRRKLKEAISRERAKMRKMELYS